MPVPHSPSRIFILWTFLLLLTSCALAQSAEVFTLSAESLQNGKLVELDKLGWKYSPNDDPRFADPQFDDRAWETLNGTAITLHSIPKSGWRGLGWFRLRLQVDPALANQPLALVMVHYGASEIYLDGKLLERLGKVGATAETEVAYNPNSLPINIVLDSRVEHVLAVRRSCNLMRDLTSGWGKRFPQLSTAFHLSTENRTASFGAGFSIALSEAKSAFAQYVAIRSNASLFLILATLTTTLGFIYLLLYSFYSDNQANLYFGLGAITTSITIAINYFLHISHNGGIVIPILFSAFWILGPFSIIFLVSFYFNAFSVRFPKRLLGASFILVLGRLLDLAQPMRWISLPGTLLTLWLTVEGVRVVIYAVRKRFDGAWILGTCLAISVPLYSVGIVLGALGQSPLAVLRVAVLIIIISISIYLAYKFSRTSRDLAAQLVEVKHLSTAALEHEKVKAEHDRKTKELEEARQLQLSMLPKKLPDLPHLDIAAFMKTASEVGGDYYDFHLGEDGTLTIAVGDATGHGLRAGTLVASIKSLFVSLAYHPDIPHIFHRMSRVLKEMKLRGLFMAMTMVKVKGQQLSVCIAGMPSVMIYRAATGDVEEVLLKAVPLGSLANYQYQQRELPLAGGDVIVLLSDGLLERFNPQQEMFEEARTKAALCACAQSAPAAIIEQLVKAGEDWAAGQTQDDDVTLVVLKMR